MIHTVLGCVNGPTVLVCFLICHTLLTLGLPSQPRLTTQPAPPPAFNPTQNTLSLQKNSFRNLLRAWFLKTQARVATKWALNNFDAWMKARNARYPDSPVPEDILMSSDPDPCLICSLPFKMYIILCIAFFIKHFSTHIWAVIA